MSSFKGKKSKISIKKPIVNTEPKEPMVQLANGNKAKESEVVIVSGDYYHINDPNIVEEHFYKEDSYMKKYFFKKNAYTAYTKINENGIPDESSRVYTQIKHHAQNFVNVLFDFATNFQVIDIDILKDSCYEECIETGNFFHKINCKGEARKTKTGTYRKVKNFYSYIPSKQLDFDDYKYGVKSPTYTVTEGKRYTFGIELETIRGYIPPRYDKLLNYAAVHDGSLREKDGSGPFGGEYVAGLLTGDMGFKQLKLLCNILNERCLLDKRCGVHVHLGGIDFNKEFVVYMYYLARKLELEIESILPASRRNNEYCKRLKNIKFNLYNINTSNYINYNEYIDKVHSEILKY